MRESDQAVRAIFDEAAEIASPAERRAYLERACAGNPQWRARVDLLLDAYDHAGSFLDAPPADLQATRDGPRITEQPGTVIGRYKLLQQIGEGGFGLVFMAEQTEPVQRKVALKIIKPGMDTKEVVARFEAERQALALMDHPHIARVFDGGTTESGRPYFVMELVRGIPITDYCDQNGLAPRDRLDLFVCVCQAVQHAHQKGIIHRDVKPNNVLVTLHDGKPVVKVIDFGVAKAIDRRLTERTLFTRYAELIGTPLYMSPEQAELSGLDVDTRTDIYSLGVLLYELLTGTTPFDKDRLFQAAYDEIRRIIREEEPVKPSTRVSTLGGRATAISAHRQMDPKRLSALLRGDLDWIVMKALEKDRTRRYATAKDFADDVEHYLTDRPVEARAPSTWYRMSKLIRRNKLLVTAASVIVLALAASSVISTRAAISANAERHLAEIAELAARQAEQRVADSFEETANLYTRQGRSAQAERLLRELLAMRVTAFGEDSPEVVDMRRRIATGIVSRLAAHYDRASTEDLGALMRATGDLIELSRDTASTSSADAASLEHDITLACSVLAINLSWYADTALAATRQQAIDILGSAATCLPGNRVISPMRDWLAVQQTEFRNPHGTLYLGAREYWFAQALHYFVRAILAEATEEHEVAADFFVAGRERLIKVRQTSGDGSIITVGEQLQMLSAQFLGMDEDLPIMEWDPDRFISTYSRLTALYPDSSGLHAQRGSQWGRKRRWSEAAADYRVAYEHDQWNTDILRALVAFTNESGNVMERNRLCREGCGRFSSVKNNFARIHIANICAIYPTAGVDYEMLYELLTEYQDEWPVRVKGLIAYRCGRFQESVLLSENSTDAYVRLVRVMALFQLGQRARAREEFEVVSNIVQHLKTEWPTIKGHEDQPVEWCELQSLAREAAAVMDSPHETEQVLEERTAH